MKLISIFFLLALVAANLIVKHFGAPGLLISSFLLIPFDFVLRCVIHENYKGFKLFRLLLGLTIAAGLCTYAINHDALNVARGSVAGIVAAQIFAGAFYQLAKYKNEGFFIKVNLSDLIAITFDSIAFQIVAFNLFNPSIMLGQIIIKFAGGLLWYFIIFKKLKLHERIIVRR